MKRTLTIILLMHALGAAAQLTPENAQKIKAMEDSIRIYGDTLINSQLQDNRTIASYRIIKTLTAAIINEKHRRRMEFLPLRNVMFT